MRGLRIAYVAHGVGGRESGVRTKILGQATAWSRLDPLAAVGIFVRCEAGTEAAWRGAPHVVSIRSSRWGLVGRLLAREWLTLDLVGWRPDVVYLRQSTVSPSLVILATLIPLIVEVNTDDLEELRIRSRWRYWWARLTRDLVLRRARRIVVVTPELSHLSAITRLGRPVSVVPNSLDLDAYPTLPAPDNRDPRLVFVGAPGLPWAGVDKIARLARAFPAWTFDLVGPEPADAGDAPGNVALHGSLTQSAYIPLLAAADVAIGPLALHRKKLEEASALKVAEYLAYGLPVIVGHVEAAIPDGVDFLLRLPNTEDNVDTGAAEIAAFVARWRGRRVARASVSAIASTTVERVRLDLIQAAAR